MSEEPEGSDIAQADAAGQEDEGGAISHENVDEAAKHDEVQELSHLTEHPKTLHSDNIRQTFGDADHVEVDRTNLEAILDVANRLKTRKSRKSMSTLALASESYKDKQVNKPSDYTYFV